MSNNSRQTSDQKRRRNIRIASWTTGGIVTLILFIILAKWVSTPPATSSNAATGASPAPQELLTKLSSLPTSAFKAVGQGSASSLPKAITASALTQGGKPRVVYIGAEYCPYCAAERWPMVIALMRFGTFTGLGITHSATADVYPNTQTFSFHGASYSSKYISFSGVETQSNVTAGNSYAPLDTPTSDEQALLNKYDTAPYVSADTAGSIPFVDFGGKYLISGATYSPSVLQNLSYDQIAADLTNSSSPVAKGIMGTANTITAAICNLTNNQPASACQIEQNNGLSAKLK